MPADAVSRLQAVPQLVVLDALTQGQLYDERSNMNMVGEMTGDYQAWLADTGYDGSGVTVAVIDSGVDWDHPELNVVSGNHYGNNSEPGEPGSENGSTHGTHVAGIVAGTGSTGAADADGYLYGLGVAPGATIHTIIFPPVDHSGWTHQSSYYQRIKKKWRRDHWRG